jgi:DNA-binding response OmpR family regulator
MRKVLVVDDEPHIRTVLRGYLEADGFVVSEAADGEAALAAVHAGEPDLVLLDVMLPGIDGIETLRQAAHFQRCVRHPGHRPHRGGGQAGRARRRRGRLCHQAVQPARGHRSGQGRSAPWSGTPAGPDARLRFAGLTVDPAGREVEVDGAPVELSSLEFDLLTALARAPGRVFSRAQLLQQVWGYDFYGDERVIDVHIRSLRARLGDDAADPHLIATAPRTCSTTAWT